MQDGKIAANLLNGLFGTNFDIPSIQMMQVRLQTVNAQLEGDDQITATAARVISGQVTFRFGGISLEVLNVITGQTLESSGAGAASYRFLDLSSFNPPYFGIIGRADSAESGDTHLFVPKCKIMEGFELKLEYNTFSIPELVCMAVADDNFVDASGRGIVIKPIQHATAKLATLPPTYV